MPRRQGFTLMEVVIAAVLAAILLGLSLAMLISAQQHSSYSATRNHAVGESRRIARLLVDQLQDLNLTTDDLEPDTPVASSWIEYRVLEYDTSSDALQLAPTRASGLFRRIWLDGEEIKRAETSGGAVSTTVVLADRVSDLQFTRTGSLLTIRVVVDLTDSEGNLVRGVAELEILLTNSQP